MLQQHKREKIPPFVASTYQAPVICREVTLAKPVTTSFKSARPGAGWRGRARITWMYDPAHFYVQLIPDGEGEGQAAEFEAMMAAMQTEFQSGPYEARSWAFGTPVAAKFRDNCWYRAKVKLVHTCTIHNLIW